MSIRKQFALLNLAWVIGVIASLFMVPGSTPFWLWAMIAGATLCALNAALWCRNRNHSERYRPNTRTMIVVLAFALLLANIIASHYIR